MKKNSLVRPPIFFIGTGRSGTTIIYEIFAQHPDVAWLSNYAGKFPTSIWINKLIWIIDNKLINLRGQKRQYSRVSRLNRYLPFPGESYNFWNLHTGVDFSRNYLLGIKASEKVYKHMQGIVDKILTYRKKSRFCAKITGPGRITFLNSIFPNAIFIHIIRDGRAVTESLMRVPFWKDRQLEPWWHGGLRAEDLKTWKDSGNNPVVLTALQWNRIVETTQQEGDCLENRDIRYLEIKYEDFLDSPKSIIESIFSFSKLESSTETVERCFDKTKIVTKFNNKFLDKWDKDTLDRVQNTIEKVLYRLGYIKNIDK